MEHLQEIARLKADLERLQGDYDATLEALQEQMETVETLQANIAEMEPAAKQTTGLQEQLRGMKHKEAFRDIAEKLGVRKEAIEDVWKLGDWKAEGDEPDPAKMQEHFQSVIKTREYLKEGAVEEGKSKRLPADEHGNRGPSSPKGEGKIRLTNEQLNDKDFMDKAFEEIRKDPMALELV